MRNQFKRARKIKELRNQLRTLELQLPDDDEIGLDVQLQDAINILESKLDNLVEEEELDKDIIDLSGETAHLHDKLETLESKLRYKEILRADLQEEQI